MALVLLVVVVGWSFVTSLVNRVVVIVSVVVVADVFAVVL